MVIRLHFSVHRERPFVVLCFGSILPVCHCSVLFWLRNAYCQVNGNWRIHQFRGLSDVCYWSRFQIIKKVIFLCPLLRRRGGILFLACLSFCPSFCLSVPQNIFQICPISSNSVIQAHHTFPQSISSRRC